MPKDSNEFDHEAQSTALQACREAHNAWRDNRKAFPELTMDLALKLAALRSSHVSNTAFSTALREAGIAINAQDRAALLNMAEHEELARKVLAETDRWSPQHIWEQEIKALLPKPDGAEAEPALADDGDTVSEDVPVDPVEAARAEFEAIEPMPADEAAAIITELERAADWFNKLDDAKVDAFARRYDVALEDDPVQAACNDINDGLERILARCLAIHDGLERIMDRV